MLALRRSVGLKEAGPEELERRKRIGVENEIVEKARKMRYNKSADKAQWERYKAVLGSNAPGSLKEFQKIKYSEAWDDFKAYSKAIKSGELTPLADFELYQDTSAKIDRALVGQTTSNGILVRGKSKHFVARVIGSVEQKRNGVDIANVLESLTNSKSEIFPVRISKKGIKSQKFRFNNIETTINPDTGNLIQVNPWRK